jgi:hypothetical protein
MHICLVYLCHALCSKPNPRQPTCNHCAKLYSVHLNFLLALQAWDVEFLYADLEQANLAANHFWHYLKDYNPMMGSCDMMNWDFKDLIVLEVTNSNVYLDL